jgi:NADH dehydrogenase FAD-containing subunit
MKTKSLVLAGAGHAHMTILSHIREIVDQGFRVVVVGPSEHHYYSGMGPGVLGGTYTPEEIRFPVKRMVDDGGGTFLLDRVVRVDPVEKKLFLESGRSVGYDVVSFNTGSFVPSPKSSTDKDRPASGLAVKPIENLAAGREMIQRTGRERTVRIGVVGGGPAGVEVAGNGWAAARDAGKGATVRLYAGKKFMPRAPERVRRLCRKELERRSVEIVEGSYVRRSDEQGIELENGRRFKEDVIFLALGVMPSRLFHDSGLKTGPDGGLAVNRYLQSPDHPELFGGGDCIHFLEQPLDKVGVYAVRENPVLFHNVLAQLKSEPLQPFDPGGDYLLVYNLGAGRGVLHKRFLSFDGRLAFRIKDFIDRKFIRRFSP